MGADIDVTLRSNGDYWLAAWTDAHGKPQRQSIGSKEKFSRRQAEAKCRQLAVDLRIGAKREGKCPRLSEWIEQYTKLRSDVGPGTKTLIDHTARYLKAFFPNDPTIDRISRADAAAWRAALAAGELRVANLYPKPAEQLHPDTGYHAYRKKVEAKPPKPLAEATVCKHVRCAKRMFAEATDETGVGFIDKNPFRKLSGRAPKVKKDWAVVTQADLTRILDNCPNDGWRALFALCRLAGLRRREALEMRWGDVRWDLNRLMVNAHIKKETTKRKPRVCPIEPARCPTGLTGLLRSYLENAAEGTRLVCAGVVADDLDRDAKAVIARAGLAPYAKPFHSLRKNREGEIAAVYPQHVFTEWMGHDAAVAEEFYLRVDDELYAAPPPAKKTRAKQIGDKRTKG